MKAVALSAQPRSLGRRAGSKRLRAHGQVPAVIYGRQTKPQNLEIDRRALETLISHSATENLLVDLAVDKDPRPKRLALLQEVQHHALSGHVLHVDLHEVSETEKVTIMVAVETVGESTGVKNGGGVLEHVLFKIKARGLPKDLPEVIHVDVSHLEIGQSIHLGDIKPPAGVELLGEKNISVISVAAPISEAQEAADAAAASATATDVEMIKEKKEEGGTAAAPAAKGAADKGAPEKAGDKAAEKGADKGAPDKKAEKKK